MNETKTTKAACSHGFMMTLSKGAQCGLCGTRCFEPSHADAPTLLAQRDALAAALRGLKTKYEEMAVRYFAPHADYKSDPSKDTEWAAADAALRLLDAAPGTAVCPGCAQRVFLADGRLTEHTHPATGGRCSFVGEPAEAS